jgi:hypothetical protein
MESGIVQYLWCVGTDNTNQNCGILPWTPVGMQTSVSAQVQHRAYIIFFLSPYYTTRIENR